jgi:hypothetical protein
MSSREIVLWTTGDADAVPWTDTYFWSDENAARDNAEASGEPLLRVTAEVIDAEEVWRPEPKTANAGDDSDLCIVIYSHRHGTDSWVARRSQVDASICASILESVSELDAGDRRKVVTALIEGRMSDAIRIYCDAAEESFEVRDVDPADVAKDSADPVEEARKLLADLDADEAADAKETP